MTDKRFQGGDDDFAIRRKLRRQRRKRGLPVKWADDGTTDRCPLSTREITELLSQHGAEGMSRVPKLSAMVTTLREEREARTAIMRLGPDGVVRKAHVSHVETMAELTQEGVYRLWACRIVSLYDEPHDADMVAEVVAEQGGEDPIGEAWNGTAQRWSHLRDMLLAQPSEIRLKKLVETAYTQQGFPRTNEGVVAYTQVAAYLSDFACWAEIIKVRAAQPWSLSLTRWWPTHDPERFLTGGEVLRIATQTPEEAAHAIMRWWDHTLTRQFEHKTANECAIRLLECNQKIRRNVPRYPRMTREEAMGRLAVTRHRGHKGGAT